MYYNKSGSNTSNFTVLHRFKNPSHLQAYTFLLSIYHWEPSFQNIHNKTTLYTKILKISRDFVKSRGSKAAGNEPHAKRDKSLLVFRLWRRSCFEHFVERCGSFTAKRESGRGIYTGAYPNGDSSLDFSAIIRLFVSIKGHFTAYAYVDIAFM